MGDQNQFPTGTVTFLFTDIEGNTRLAQEHPNEMPKLLARHNTILNQSMETVYHNLPPQLTSFIGRERELAETRETLASARILTFIGPGGTGKTWLCLQVAAEQLSEFKDIDLALGENDK